MGPIEGATRGGSAVPDQEPDGQRAVERITMMAEP